MQDQDRRSQKERKVLDIGQPISHAGNTFNIAVQLSQGEMEIRKLREAGR